LHLFHHYAKVSLIEKEPEYEPLANVLMVKEMHIELA